MQNRARECGRDYKLFVAPGEGPRSRKRENKTEQHLTDKIILHMKIQLKSTFAYVLASLLIIVSATSCKKEISGTNGTDTGNLTTTSTSSTIAVSTNGTSDHSGGDSVYIMNPCAKGTHRDSVAASALPTSVNGYLTTNYSGYVFNKAFAVKDTTGTVKGYVVIVNYNGKPVGLEFKADGTFVKVLEQRERGDMNNNGWHTGGRFENRCGLQKDTIALAGLSTEIKTYLSANYAGDTLVRAFKVAGDNYVVLSRNNGLFATAFSKSGTFIARVSLTALLNTRVTVTDATLPIAAANYLTATYPNYILNKSFSVSFDGSVKGYLALIDANNTRYCVAFDTNGNFVGAKTIW